jgi:hypothetical protein
MIGAGAESRVRRRFAGRLLLPQTGKGYCAASPRKLASGAAASAQYCADFRALPPC